MPGILIFESDMEFAEGLKGELARRGCQVDVVNDAAIGLERAAQNPPDLILLCTELPRMNGFSVCNRLKRDPVLESVPVIIMSANSSEETFQQHRNLTKKRAQDYVHKPVTVDEMLGRVGQFVSLNGHAAPPPPAVNAALDELDVEDMEEMDELGEEATAVPLAPPVSQRPAPASERSMNQLTEEVFGTLMQGSGFGSTAPSMGTPVPPPASQRPPVSQLPPASQRPLSQHPSAVPQPPAPQSQSQYPSAQYTPSSTLPPGSQRSPTTQNFSQYPGGSQYPAPPAPGSAPGAPLAEVEVQAPSKAARSAPDASRRSSRSPRRRSGGPSVDSIPPVGRLPMISEPALDGEVSREHAEELERTLAETRAKLEAVYQELEAARTKESGGSARAHEILDLREALNKKEKELLELRDQLTRQGKDLLSANDSMLELERKHTESKDHLSEVEKRVHAAERAQQAAAQDREQANKRADGYKRKLEKTLEDLEHVTVEHEELSAERKRLIARAEQAEATGQELSTKLAEAARRADDLQADLADAEKELANLEAQNEQLQRRLQGSDLLQQQTQQAYTQLNERYDQQRAMIAQVHELLAQATQRLEPS